MTYHGNGASWSKARLNEVVDTYLQGARKVTVLDIHTGFGEFGQGMVMSYDPPDSEKYQRVSQWFSGDIFTPGSDPNIPSHSIRLPFEWMEQRLAGVQATAAILEFGTFPPEEIGEIFNANHHFHVFGDPLSKDGLAWGSRYRRFCYPETEEWKRKVWQRGREVIETLLAGFDDWDIKHGK
jgi:hypothetical protein